MPNVDIIMANRNIERVTQCDIFSQVFIGTLRDAMYFKIVLAGVLFKIADLVYCSG